MSEFIALHPYSIYGLAIVLCGLHLQRHFNPEQLRIRARNYNYVADTLEKQQRLMSESIWPLILFGVSIFAPLIFTYSSVGYLRRFIFGAELISDLEKKESL